MKKIKILFILVAILAIATPSMARKELATTADKIGVDSNSDLLWVVSMPTSIDDLRLISETQTSNDTSYCVGEDGNPVQIWSTWTTYSLVVSIPELNFWNMNNLNVSVRYVDENSQIPFAEYSDYRSGKNPDSHTITLSVAYKDCYSGYPEGGYYDYDKQQYICGPFEGGGCWTYFDIAGDALISLRTQKAVK